MWPFVASVTDNPVYNEKRGALEAQAKKEGWSDEERIHRLNILEASFDPKFLPFAISAPRGLPDRLIDTAGGLAAMLVRFAVIKKFIPSQLFESHPVLANALMWEVENTKGPRGSGALAGATFGVIGQLKAVTTLAKAGKLSAESAALAGITAAHGGDPTDILISALLPPAMHVVGIAGDIVPARQEAKRMLDAAKGPEDVQAARERMANVKSVEPEKVATAPPVTEKVAPEKMPSAPEQVVTPTAAPKQPWEMTREVWSTLPERIPAQTRTVNIDSEIQIQKALASSANPIEASFAKDSLKDLAIAKRNGVTSYDMPEPPPPGYETSGNYWVRHDLDTPLASHRSDTRRAVKSGQPVPRAVLQEYAGQPWADAALAKMEVAPEQVATPTAAPVVPTVQEPAKPAIVAPTGAPIAKPGLAPAQEGASLREGGPAETIGKGLTVAAGLEPITGTGEVKPRGVSVSVEERAVAQKLVDTLGDLPEYRTVNLADKAKEAENLRVADPVSARRIAMALESPPRGILPEAVFLSVENQAMKTGDVETIRDLAQSPLTAASTTMGQRNAMWAMRDPESPIGAIQEVGAARKQQVARAAKGRDLKTVIDKDVKTMKREISKLTSSRERLQAFINAVIC
jgi:hypothetical protein